MNPILKTGLALALSLAAVSAADARPPAPWGGGYYGSAWYNSGQGSVVAGAATWAECNQLLQSSINQAVFVWGWSVVTYTPCHYQAPFQYIMADKEGVEITAGSPGDSAGTVRAITEEIVRVRGQFRADDYENAMRDVYRAIDGK